MSADYEPGTVAVATVRGVPNVRVFRKAGGWWSVAEPGPQDETLAYDRHVTDVRPLVVIDPEDREQVERLLTAYVAPFNDFVTERRVAIMQESLREFANPTPPKPPEPQGLGAVVEDAEGNRWVRASRTSTVNHWRCADVSGVGRKPYDRIAAVKVLSEGVQ